MTLDELNLALLIGALVLLAVVGAVQLSSRLGLPSLLVYLAVGLLLGESGLGVHFDNAQLAETSGIAALVIILAEGGVTTRWSEVRDAVPIGAVLATVGVALSVVVTGVATRLLLDVEWRYALLLGAIVSSTDAAAVFSILRRLPLRRRPAASLEVESGFNDAPVVILVILLSDVDAAWSAWGVAAQMVYQLAIGGAIGVAVGWVGARALRRAALPASGLYPLGVFAFAVLAYGAATGLRASGFLAVFVAGIVLGNARLPHRPATRSFAEGLAWLAQIGLFVLLGLLANPSELDEALVPALAVGAVLLLLARPLSVALSAAPFRLPWREGALLSWGGLRGAVPIVLATIPVTQGVPGSGRLFNIVFLLVVIFTLVQGTTIPLVARRLGLVAAGETRELRVEAAPLENLAADLLQLQIPAGSRMHGVQVMELRLPAGSAVTLLIRGDHSFVPGGDTVLQTGDELLVVTGDGRRDEVERRLRAVSRAGRLAAWYGEHGRSR